MHAFQTTLLLALAALTTARNSPIQQRQTDNNTQYAEPITIGQRSWGHGGGVYAWTPTKTSILDACKDGSATVELQTVNTNIYDKPMCGVPFSLDGRDNLTVECADGTEETSHQATAIATNGEITHNCVELPLTVYSTYCGDTTSLSQRFMCQ